MKREGSTPETYNWVRNLVHMGSKARKIWEKKHPMPELARKRRAARLSTLRQARAQRLAFQLRHKGWDYE